MTRQTRGTTLIELLIVVAILAIMSAALLAVVIAPVKEQVVTDIRMGQLEGTTLLLTTLVEDGRTASHASLSDDRSCLHLHLNDPEGWHVVYHLDDRGIIRRHYRPSIIDADALLEGDADALVKEAGTPLLAMVHRFSVEPTDDGRILKVEVETKVNRMHEDHTHTRSVELFVPHHHQGGQP